jgi:hypothetical protein
MENPSTIRRYLPPPKGLPLQKVETFHARRQIKQRLKR